VQCKENYIAKSGGFCIPCPPGYQASADQSECVQCAQGFFSPNGELCALCPDGFITTDPGADECLPCPPGRTSNAAHTQCVLCSAGFSSVEGGQCTKCLPGHTARPGGLCEPCAPGTGDTETVLGTCTPCPAGYSSILGGTCTKCPVGYDSDRGGLCRPCPLGWSSVPGKLCEPCPAGFSAYPGGSCFACPAGQFSYSGGACANCPEKYSSPQGSPGCFACGFGQTSIAGGECVDLCQDGQAWSQAYQLCTVCPAHTVALSGSTSCTRCPFGHYAPAASGSCFPQDRVGGILRVDIPFEDATEEAIVRDLANLLDAETRDFKVHLMRPGSTVLYFTIADPPASDLTLASSEVRRLGGNEKMLLLYQWWVMGDSRLDRLSYDILDLKEFMRVEGNTTAGTVVDRVVPLFAPSSDPSASVPPQAFFKTSNGGITWRTKYGEPKSLLLNLEVGAAVATKNISFAVTLICLLISTLMTMFIL